MEEAYEEGSTNSLRLPFSVVYGPHLAHLEFLSAGDIYPNMH